MVDSSSTKTSTGHTLGTFHDSGAPDGSTDYTTVVLVHGWSWHSAVFKKLLPFARQFNARLVFVNRRDYPGAEPYTPEELANAQRLASAPRSPEADAEAQGVLRDRARELYDFLADFVRRERIPPAQGHAGGLVVAGWSFAAIWISALLANVRLFPVGDVDLSKYVRRAILLDATYLFYGYASPPKWYKPLFDTTISEDERLKRFLVWITGYFAHGDVWADGHEALEFREWLTDPAPTNERFTPADNAETTIELPGSEWLFAQICNNHGVYDALREGGLYLHDPVEGASNWPDVEVKHLWCDRSVWEMPWGAKLLSEELEEAKKAGKRLRNNALVRFKGANHFASWDLPERTLKALLSDEAEIY